MVVCYSRFQIPDCNWWKVYCILTLHEFNQVETLLNQ